jgi:hypothetical protein
MLARCAHRRGAPYGRPCASPHLVTTGLDPVDHAEARLLTKSERALRMDCRIRSGNDDVRNRSRDAIAPELCFTNDTKLPPNKKGGGAPTGASIQCPRHTRRRYRLKVLRARKRATQTNVTACLRCGRARLSALRPRLSPSFLGLAQPQARASWNRNGPDRSIPGQRAPRGPVVMPAGRVPGAARERGYEPRARAPHSLRFQDRI